MHQLVRFRGEFAADSPHQHLVIPVHGGNRTAQLVGYLQDEIALDPIQLLVVTELYLHPPALLGDSLFDALYHSVDPYYAGLSRNNGEVHDLLERLHLDKNVKIEDLDNNQKKQLQSFLLFKLIKNGCQKNILDTVIRDRYQSDMFQCELERFADLLDACGKVIEGMDVVESISKVQTGRSDKPVEDVVINSITITSQ